MKIALITLNPIVGDFSGNLKKVCDFCQEAQNANLVVFPELALIGYPPQDLLLRPSFPQFAKKQLDDLATFLNKPPFKHLGVVVGTIVSNPTNSGPPLVNCAAFIQGGTITYRAKTLIPNYTIFNEQRYFASAKNLPQNFLGPILFQEKKIGLLICEDSWEKEEKYNRKLYVDNPVADLVRAKCHFAINISASPFSIGQKDRRRRMIQSGAKQITTLYVSQSGAQDELIFDGDQFVMDKTTIIEGKRFVEDVLYIDLEKKITSPKPSKEETLSEMEEIKRALCMGIQDYMAKNKFKKIILGLSGGIDSAVVAALAADAVGPENILGVTLPGPHSSSHSVTDTEALVSNLGIQLYTIPIKFLDSVIKMTLKPYFEGRTRDVTEENIQARTRGLLLMALANKFQSLLLATGNKSELAMGYATLYGDMCGALAPIGDLYKTQVYALARHLNLSKERIPEHTIKKAPSAELSPNQTDQQTLPPYKDLDSMLYYLIEQEKTLEECWTQLQSDGLKVKKATLSDIERRLWQSEYKRKQFAPILRVSQQAFGMGRRYPITKQIPIFN